LLDSLLQEMSLHEEDQERRLLVEHPLEKVDLDQLLERRLGEFGRYQKVIYFLVCLPAALTASITLAAVFNNYSPAHRCQIPVCDSPVIPHYRDAFNLGFANFSIPLTKDNSTWDSCHRFQEISKKRCEASSFGSQVTECDNVLFKKDTMERTVVTDFSLVCQHNWKVPLSESIFFGGVLAGALVFGQLGDSLGRKNVFLWSMVQTLLCSLASVFSPDMTTLMVLQFLTAMGQVGVFQTCFVLGVELVGKSKRVFCGIIIEFFFVFGELALGLIAWALRDWRKLVLAYTIPSFLFLLYHFILPKSIRWLITNKKYVEAERELAKVAKWNNVEPLTRDELKNYEKLEDEGEERESILDLVRRPKLLSRLLIVFLAWIVTTMVYYGLSLNASSLVGDLYVNFALLSLVELPGYALSYVGMTYWGRKGTMIASLLVGGVACFLTTVVPSTWTTVQTILFLTGKVGVTSAFGTAYLYTSELFPTTVRNVCVGLSSMTGRIGAIVSPYVVGLGTLTGQDWLPMTVFAVGAVISGLMVFFLPETKDKALPKTLHEAETLTNRTASSQD